MSGPRLRTAPWIWFRRDQRAYAAAALYCALNDSRAAHCAFVFDTELLDSLPRHDRRIESQSEKLDPEGKFIRRYLPQLRSVAACHIHAPWKMRAADQLGCGVLVGKDYPAPMVNHADAPRAVLELYGRSRDEVPELLC